MKSKRPTKSKALRPAKATSGSSSRAVAGGREATFREVVGMIQAARGRALQAVNTELVELYWQVGGFISRKIETAAWGEGVVDELARFIARRHPDIKGFTRPNLFRMRQFHQTYRRDKKVSPLVRQLPWTHNLLILMRCKRPEEREFYLRLAAREKWAKRELERQLNGALFVRAVLAPPKVSPLVTQLHPAAGSVFKDTYLLDFLDLPAGHSEDDLQRGLIANLKKFLIELGRDFAFVGEQYVLQVGGRDFRLDLLFFHRELQCLVALELKIEEFQPEHLGKLEFYLDALDRDVRKPHERPSIGVLLCATKDNEVVEPSGARQIRRRRTRRVRRGPHQYALSRTASPALIAEYETQLPDRTLLLRNLHEFYELAQSSAETDTPRIQPHHRPGHPRPRAHAVLRTHHQTPRPRRHPPSTAPSTRLRKSDGSGFRSRHFGRLTRQERRFCKFNRRPVSYRHAFFPSCPNHDSRHGRIADAA